MKNHLGIVLNTDVAGESMSYGAFGESRNAKNVALTVHSDPAMYGYAGMQYDAETATPSYSGLYYDRARAFDPTLGRFTSPDPSGFSAGDSNFYRYAHNSPVVSTDPTGRLSPIGVGIISYCNTLYILNSLELSNELGNLQKQAAAVQTQINQLDASIAAAQQAGTCTYDDLSNYKSQLAGYLAQQTQLAAEIGNDEQALNEYKGINLFCTIVGGIL